MFVDVVCCCNEEVCFVGCEVACVDVQSVCELSNVLFDRGVY